MSINEASVIFSLRDKKMMKGTVLLDSLLVIQHLMRRRCSASPRIVPEASEVIHKRGIV